MPRASLLALGTVVVLWIIQLGMSNLSADLQQQLSARQQTVQEEWNRGYRLCRCEACCQDEPSYERTNFVVRTRPPVHAAAHGLAGEGLFCHFSRAELYQEHLTFLSGVQQPQHGSDRSDPTPSHNDPHSPPQHDPCSPPAPHNTPPNPSDPEPGKRSVRQRCQCTAGFASSCIVQLNARELQRPLRL